MVSLILRGRGHQVRASLQSLLQEVTETGTQNRGRIEKIAKTHKSLIWRHVQPQHSKQITHTLHILDVRAIELIDFQELQTLCVQCLPLSKLM